MGKTMKKYLAVIAALFFVSGSVGAQTISPPSTTYSLLYVTGTSVGNGADTTVDTLQTFQLPAGQLANVGDVVKITASGTFAASTDSKTASVTFGGLGISAQAASSVGAIRWSVTIWVIKTGSNQQTRLVLADINGSTNSGSSSGIATITDTSPITINVTGQNATNPVAGSVTCGGLIVEYFHK